MVKISPFFSPKLGQLPKIMVTAVNKYTQGGQPNFNSMIIKKLTMPLPPLPEQEAIAEILTQQDRLIDLKQQLILEKRRQKKYLMQTLLTGRIRLPGFNGKWKNVRLGDVVILEYGKPLKESQRTDGIYPVLGSNGRIGSHNTFLVSGPCIIIGRKGSAGEIVWEEQNCYPIDTTFYVQTRITITLKYIYYLLLIQKMVDEKQNSSVPGLNRNDVYRIKVSLPPLPEQETIAEILSTADEELSLLERELEQEKLRKKALMQLLLTGLVRVEEL